MSTPAGSRSATAILPGTAPSLFPSSHAAELRQRIPAQVRVHRGHASSHLTVCAHSG